jgi:hypothetical protein
MQIALHKLAAVDASTNTARSAKGFSSFLRAEFPLIVGLASAAIFLVLGSGAVEEVDHPLALAGVFVWLLIGVLWSAISVVRHADGLALRCGEPYGTLILTLSAITIEVVMISAAMLHGANNPTLARDMMFAVVAITLNGLVGLALLLGDCATMNNITISREPTPISIQLWRWPCSDWCYRTSRLRCQGRGFHSRRNYFS